MPYSGKNVTVRACGPLLTIGVADREGLFEIVPEYARNANVGLGVDDPAVLEMLPR